MGFSFTAQAHFTSVNLIHVGVINVSILLVLILFWLDVYYQNLLYGSVLRTRFLEFCRLKSRLSIYISGVYTGAGLGKSGMAWILYLIYAGFLIGTFYLGWIVISLPLDSVEPNSSNQAPLEGRENEANIQNKSGEQNNTSEQSGSILENLKNYVKISLWICFILSGVGMIVIGIVCIRKRDNKLTKPGKKIEDCVFTKTPDNAGRLHITGYNRLIEKEIDDLELQIFKEFTPRI